MGIRGKEDPWNSIGSGAITGAVLAARGEIQPEGLQHLHVLTCTYKVHGQCMWYMCNLHACRIHLYEIARMYMYFD